MYRAEVKCDFEGAMRKLKRKEEVMPMLSEQVLKDSNRYIPKLSGALEGSGLANTDFRAGDIRWRTPYARRLYYNPQYNFSHDVNPNAGGLWFEVARAKHMSEWEQVVARGYTQ